jgi:lysyl-tRNA synthetase class 2
MSQPSETRNEREVRIAKADAIRQMGITPYAAGYDKQHMISELIAREKDSLRDIETIIQEPKSDWQTAGRVLLKRTSGKISFAKIMDESGEIQLMFEYQKTKISSSFSDTSLMGDSTKTPDYRFLEKYVDIGDFIGVRGELFHTHKGELTLFVSEFSFLAKALRPLGDKFHGIGENQEKAYRQRYLDTIMNRDSHSRFLIRSKFLKTIREFYRSHGFIEVETPVL